MPQPPIVLYVDDEPVNLRVFDANFNERFHVVTFVKAFDALDFLKARGMEVGVVIADQRMPHMTGAELLEQAKALSPDAQRMLITAYSDMQVVMEAVNRGQVARYFVKPWAREELNSAIEDALRIFELRQQLRQMELRVLQSERLAALGQVTAGVAHELMSPVSYLGHSLDVLKETVEKVSRGLGAYWTQQPDDELQRQWESLPGLIADLETGVAHVRFVALNVRGQLVPTDEPSTCAVDRAADFASKLVRAELGQWATISVEGEPLMVHGASSRLSQLLLNLLLNGAEAVKRSGRTGSVRLSWKAVDAQSVRVMAEDTGDGVPPELQEKVFEPFFSTKPAGEGTGLGLSISKEIVASLGGAVRLHSESGRGAQFELLLKRA